MLRIGAAGILFFGIGVFGVAGPRAQAQPELTRGVHIIDNAGPSSASPSVEPPAAALGAPSATTPHPMTVAPPSAIMSEPKILPESSAQIENSAGLALDILPGNELHIGEKIVLRVSTKRAGYLVVFDIGADGKVTQLYPNIRSLMTRSHGRVNANRIEPGHAIRIPNLLNPYAGFELIASPPAGVATVLAMLSDRPVQVVDLPDVPAAIAGQPQAISFLQNAARKLLVTAAGATSGFEPVRWSFDAKFYAVR